MPFMLLSPENEYIVLKEENDDVILPCRSTSAEYSVKLYNSIDDKVSHALDIDYHMHR